MSGGDDKDTLTDEGDDTLTVEGNSNELYVSASRVHTGIPIRRRLVRARAARRSRRRFARA